jgi:hypothetical protein
MLIPALAALGGNIVGVAGGRLMVNGGPRRTRLEDSFAGEGPAVMR